MKKSLLIFVSLLLTNQSGYSQQWINTHFDNHRLDYRDLGYPTQNLIPADNSQITALMTHSNGFVYGATSGKTQSYLFFYNQFINKVRPLGKISNATGVYHCLLEGKNGEIYIGTGLNMLAPLKLTKDFPVKVEGIEEQLWKDIKTPYQEFEGGHIYKYNPKTGDVNRYTNDDSCPLEDLGIPVANNSIYAMEFDSSKTVIYGMTYPDANFFVFDLKTKKIRNFGDIMTHKIFSGPERYWRTVPRDLYCHPVTGQVYMSGDNGFIIKYNPTSDKIEMTWMRLPGEYWEGLKSWDYPVVECFEPDNDGNIYVGTNDGYLLKLDIANDDIIVLGKPRMMRRMRAMKLGKDNNMYIITGEFERMCKLHIYDLAGERGFSELGPFAVDRSPYYSKRAYQFDAMAVGPDGTVFCGESDRKGNLFLYIPGSGNFKGRLNPTNPVVERQREDTPALIPERL